MTVNMKLVPNPADGLAQAIGDLLNKGLGFGKNTIDLFSVATTCVIGLLFTGNVVAIGLGTLIAMIGVGRCIALFNFVFKKKMDEVSGLVNYEVEVEGCSDKLNLKTINNIYSIKNHIINNSTIQNSL